MGRFGHPKRPNRGRFGLTTWAVFDIRVGRFGFGPFWSFPLTNTRQKGCHLLLLENGRVLEQDPTSTVPEQHQEASLHARHTMKTTHNVQLATYSVAMRRPLPFVPQTARTTRSSDTNLLCVPRVHTCFGSRGFSITAPTIWNSLPLDIRNSCSIASFRRQLKTFLFSTSGHL